MEKGEEDAFCPEAELVPNFDHGVLLEGVNPLVVFFGALLDVDFSLHSLVNFAFGERWAGAMFDFDNLNDGKSGGVFERSHEVSGIGFFEEGIAKGERKVRSLGVFPKTTFTGKGTVRVFFCEFGEVGSAFEFEQEFFSESELAFGGDVGVEAIPRNDEDFAKRNDVLGSVTNRFFALVVFGLSLIHI